MQVSQRNFIGQTNNKYNKKNVLNIKSSGFRNDGLNAVSNKDIAFKGVGKFVQNKLNPAKWGEAFFSCDKVSGLFKKLAEFKPMRWVSEKLQKDATNIVFKQPALDLVGCVLYVNAALNNKQVPSDKRPFIAAYDAVNGVTTVLLSIGFGLLGASEKFAKKVNKTLFRPLKHSNLRAYNAMPKFIQATFGIVASTILAKRILAPLISTPTATVMKNKFGGKKSGRPSNDKAIDKTAISSKPVDNKIATEKKAEVPAMLSVPKASNLKTSELFARLQQKKV